MSLLAQRVCSSCVDLHVFIDQQGFLSECVADLIVLLVLVGIWYTFPMSS